MSTIDIFTNFLWTTQVCLNVYDCKCMYSTTRLYDDDYMQNINLFSHTQNTDNDQAYNIMNPFQQILSTLVKNFKYCTLKDQLIENKHQLKENRRSRRKIQKIRNKQIKKDTENKNNLSKIEKISQRHYRTINQRNNF